MFTQDNQRKNLAQKRKSELKSKLEELKEFETNRIPAEYKERVEREKSIHLQYRSEGQILADMKDKRQLSEIVYRIECRNASKSGQEVPKLVSSGIDHEPGLCRCDDCVAKFNGRYKFEGKYYRFVKDITRFLVIWIGNPSSDVMHKLREYKNIKITSFEMIDDATEFIRSINPKIILSVLYDVHTSNYHKMTETDILNFITPYSKHAEMLKETYLKYETDFVLYFQCEESVLGDAITDLQYNFNDQFTLIIKNCWILLHDYEIACKITLDNGCLNPRGIY